MFGAAEPAQSLLTRSTVGYSPQITSREQNLNTARELLAQAGVDEGAVLNLWVSGDIRQKAAEVIQANLREIGINVAIQSYEWGRFMEGTSAGEHDAYIIGWTIGTGDADGVLYSLAHSSAQGAAGNRAFYSNTEVDNLLDMAREELNPVQRNEYYNQVQQILHDDMPYIPMSHRIYPVAMHSNVRGFVYEPITVHRFRSVYFDDSMLAQR